jgi:hypothetical protein
MTPLPPAPQSPTAPAPPLALRQRRLWKRREFSLRDGYVHARESNGFASVGYRLRLVDLALPPVELDRSSKAWFAATAFCALLTLLTAPILLGVREGEVEAPFFYGALTLVCGLLYGASRARLYIVEAAGGGRLVLEREAPSPAAVADFLAALRGARRALLREQLFAELAGGGARLSAAAAAELLAEGVISAEEHARLTAAPDTGHAPPAARPAALVN